MPRHRLLTTVLPLLLFMLAAFWYFSPYLTLHAMRSAARAHDAQALALHVDFPKVRSNLKEQLRAATAAKVRELGDDASFAKAGAAFGALLGNVVVDKMVDLLVTPARLADAMREGKVRVSVKDGQHDDGTAAGGNDDNNNNDKKWTFERRGINVLAARAVTGNDEPATAFVLERQGFATWKLVAIELPDGRL